jgi:23S rRNA (pseudouridine1915-N3)-methyltransferase
VRVIILAVGRDRTGPAQELFEDYRRRSLWPIELIEVVAPASLPAPRRRAEEASRLLGSLPRGAIPIALDERGRQLDSAGFASRLGRWRDRGESQLAFLIGGPDGLAPAALERASAIYALGRMTWPHRLVRVLLVEQLYRAQAILAGHPYHRGSPLD